MNNNIEENIKLTNHSNNFFAVDLFAGCGGLSEGFTQAGFNVIAHVESNKWACESLKTRHIFWELKKNQKLALYYSYLRNEISRDDIFETYPEIKNKNLHSIIQATFGEDSTKKIISKIKYSMKLNDALKIDVLLGGPPCQPYSVVGRSRDPGRMENDHRHYLYKYYLELLDYFQPDFFVYENVPGLFTAKYKGENIFHRMFQDFSSLKQPYSIVPPLDKIHNNYSKYYLNCVHYQVPQIRKRFILIGYKKAFNEKNADITKIFDILQSKSERNIGKKYLTVEDAIGDLPKVKPGNGDDSWYGAYSINKNLTKYQKKMRYESPGILNHKARPHMDSDLERYKFFIEHHINGNGAARLNILANKRPDLVPQHKHLDKFMDRFKVQWWDKPSSTIMAHIHKDGHYYIHPDVLQCRSFTVREAARCQSFPDNFKFEGPRTEQFKQVGNAVPPQLAFAIGKTIMKELKKIYSS